MSSGSTNGQELIAEAFEVNFGHALAGAAGGADAYAVIDRRDGRTGLMAIEVAAGAPARAAELHRFLAGPVTGVLSPLAVGPARDGRGRSALYVIYQAPPGRALVAAGLAQFAPWGEGALLNQVLRPAAQALDLLRQRHITHRAIRPDNLFQIGVSEPVVLGSAWSEPPAMRQSAIYEPPYSAMCLPAGRGDGGIADDVYALGVTLLVLALGREPMAGMDARSIIQAKLERGSFTALVGDARLPPAIQDIVRGMLAEDPDHRPTPALLVDIEVARGRRVAARPPRRAQRPLEVGATAAWTARTLAFAVASEPDAGIHALRSGTIDQWIRRSLGDSALAARLEDVVRLRGGQAEAATARDDAALAMRAVAILDPLAPVCWNGIAVWPDGLGPALAAAQATGEGAAALAPLSEIVADEAIGSWATLRAERCDAPTFRLDAHQHRAMQRQKGWAGGMARLSYALNPLLPCRSPLLTRFCVTRLPDLLPALEACAAQNELREAGPLDPEIAAFLAARSEMGLEGEMAALGDARRQDTQMLVMLRILTAVQTRTRGAATPALARAMAARVAPAMAMFQGRSRRTRREAALEGLAATGRLAGLLGLLDDPEELTHDRQERATAMAQVAAIDRQLATIAANTGGRTASARDLGHEIVGAAGALALIYAIMQMLLA